MRVEGGQQPKPAQKTQKTEAKTDGKPENLDEQMKDFPKQQSLISVLRNPELKKKLEEKVGEELVAKLDKIFNAQPPGTPPPVQQQPAQAGGAQPPKEA